MIRIDMSLKDYIFLKDTVPSMEKYVTCITYQDQSVRIEIPEKFMQDFLLDYRSSYVRFGSEGKSSLNSTGVRMDRIYLESIEPALHRPS